MSDRKGLYRSRNGTGNNQIGPNSHGKGTLEASLLDLSKAADFSTID